jgi:hypothetical protein
MIIGLVAEVDLCLILRRNTLLVGWAFEGLSSMNNVIDLERELCTNITLCTFPLCFLNHLLLASYVWNVRTRRVANLIGLHPRMSLELEGIHGQCQERPGRLAGYGIYSSSSLKRGHAGSASLRAGDIEYGEMPLRRALDCTRYSRR